METGTTYAISFYYRAPGWNAEQDNFRIQIGNAPNPTAMTAGTLIFEKTGLPHIGAWTQVTVLYTATETGVRHLGFQNLTPAGLGNWVGIDGISITEAVANNLEIVASYFPYTRIPASQLNPSAQARNNGFATQTNVKLTATLNGSPFGESATVAPIAQGEMSPVMTVTPATTPAVATNQTMVLTVAGDQTNQGTDNTATFTFAITENMFANDNLTDVTEAGVGFNSGGTMATVFEVTSATTLSAIQLLFGTGIATTPSYTLRVSRMTGPLTASTTPVVTRTQNRVPGLVNIDFSADGVILEPGRYAVSLQSATNIGISYDGPGVQPWTQGGWHQLDPTTGSMTYVSGGGQGFGSLGIRMIIDDNPIAVVSTTPADNATDVAIDAQVKVTFNQDVTLGDASGITFTPTVAGVSANVVGSDLIIAHANFAYETVYTVTVPAGAITGYALPITWSFTTIAQPIAVVSTTPANNAADVEIDAEVKVTFNQDVTLGDASGITFTPTVAGVSASVVDNELIIAHDNFEEGTLYTVNVPAEAIVGLADPISWTFTTVFPPAPFPDPTAVVVNVVGTTATLTWNHTASDPAESFNIFLDGELVANVTGLQHVFTSLAPASYIAGVQAVGPDSVVSNRIPYAFTILPPITVVSTTPADDATDVALDAQVKVTFSRAVTAGTLTGISFTPTVAGVSANVVGSDLIIAHANFAYGTEYTVTVPVGAIVGYDEVITWSFTTVAQPIVVASTTPANNATNVAIDAEVKVTFNQAVTAGTLTGITFSPTVAGVSANVVGSELIITHGNFAESTSYTVTVPVGAIVGYEQAITWSFTTVQGTGVQTFEANAISIYPNPTDDILHIQATGPVMRIEIYDLNGRLVRTFVGDTRAISVGDLNVGTYVIRITTENGTITQRFVRK